jgi:uridine phosphorylase
VAPDALLPGDPGRALALAQILMVKPLMANHARGLWGYHGHTEAGHPLTIQATGIGGASAAIVLTELAGLGLRRAVRIGTCRALNPQLELGAVVAVSGAIAEEGSAGTEGLVRADWDFAGALLADGLEPVTVVSTDRYYDSEAGAHRRRVEQGAAAVEMGAATLFATGRRLGVTVGCLLVVAEADGERISDDDLAESSERMGRLAEGALRATRSGPA